MATLKAYRLADKAKTIPMPDRAGRLFSAAPEGETVDTENRFYVTLIADGDIVAVEEPTPPAGPAEDAAKPTPSRKGS